MFTADDIKTRIRREPFRPLRVVTSSGQSYDIHHPELVLIGRRALIIGIPSNDSPDIFESDNYVAIMHITDLQDFPVSKPAGGNGEG